MNKIIEIQEEAAKNAHKNTNRKGKKLLEDLLGKKTFFANVMERIKTVKDVLEDNGLTEQEFNESCRDLSQDEKAYRFLKLMVKSLNEGWLPDWGNDNEYKYQPFFNMNDTSSPLGFSFDGVDGWRAASHVGSRLCFKSRELAKYAATQFIGEYKNYMLINK